MSAWINRMRALGTQLAALLRLNRPGLRGKAPGLVVAGFLTLAMAIFIGVGLARADGQNGTTLSSTVSITPHYTRTFGWTIQKSVSPGTWNLFNGDSGTSGYTVGVTKDSGTDAAWFDGQICVTNGGAVDTQDLAITADLTMPPSSTVIATTTVDVSSETLIPAGQTACYNYHLDVPSGSISPGDSYKVTSHVTISNHSGHLDTPFGPNTANSTTLPTNPTLINDTIHVNDSNGSSWSFSASGSQTYSKTFTCGGDKGQHDNTATIQETGQKASASVTVNCYTLDPGKTALTSLTRTYNWQIQKSADQSSLTLTLGQQFTVNYTVTANTTGYTDSNWVVAGNIVITNNAPIAATLNSVSDVVSTGITVTPDCGVSFPYTLAANSTLPCSYSTSLPDGTTRTNTATVTQQNYSYDANRNATANGTTDTTATASVDFSKASVTFKDTTASVSDSLQGALGTANIGSNTFNYSRTVGPYNTCGDYSIPNTAGLTTSDTGATQQSNTWTVSIHVPCNLGCTLTIGYWKTHAGGVGNNPDMVTKQLPILLGTLSGAKTVTVSTASQAVTILGMSGNASNGINKLYAQLLAAKLNIATGASSSAITPTINAADTFLATHNANDWSSLTKTQQQQVLSWMTALDNYNSGLTGPGHCSQ